MSESVVNAQVILNTPNKLTIYIYWPIVPKKNSKQIVRGRLISSSRYLKWHKELTDILWKEDRLYDKFPCKISITSIVGTRVKSDIDNATSSILDLFTDLWIIPDDNRFIVPELNVLNVWYAKNCFITKVVMEPYTNNSYDITDDHKDKDLKNYVHYLDWYALNKWN